MRKKKSHRRRRADKARLSYFGTFGASKAFTTEDTEDHRGTLSKAKAFLGIGARMKKKGTGKAVAKKSAKKRSAAKGKKELSAAEVRNDISRRVKSRAAGMAEAVMDEGDKGQLAPMKYLFEMANIFPPANDGSEASKEEESLAKTLLDRLKIPHEPAPSHDEDEDGDTVVIPARVESAEEDVAEVRSHDFGWGISNDQNLLGRFSSETFTLPRLTRSQTYFLRLYDGSFSPPRYSRYSAALHIDVPLT